MNADDIIVLENSLKYLRRHLAFPKKKDMKNPGLIFYLKFVILNLTTVMFLTGIFMHLGVNVKRKTFINLDLDLAFCISLTGSYYFNFSYLRQVQNTIKLYQKLSDLKTYGIPDNFHEKNKKLNYLSKCHYIYIICVMIGVSVAPLLDFQKCKKENMEKNFNEICGLIANIWLPIDFDYFPYKQLYYIFQSYCCCVLYQTSSLISFSIVETVEHLVLRLRHVRIVFQQALAEKDYVIRRRKFKNAVDYHVHIFELAKMVNVSFDMCMFMHVLLTGAILGCDGYRLLRSYSIGALSFFIGWLVSIVIVCISGQRLRDEGMSIGDGIYHNSNWTELDKGLQKDLIIVMLRSQKPLYLNAGPFGYMTCATILTIMKTCYSYIALLNQTNNRRLK